MRTVLWVTLLAMAALPVAAELQSVEVGGELRIRARANMNYQNTRGEPNRVLIPGGAVWGRPIGASGLGSRFRFDDRGEDRHYVETQTRLNVTARFTDDVSTFIEFEHSDIWGSDFRSNFITGADVAGAGDISLLQSYIEANDFLGYPLRLRIGRQTLKQGKGWLVGDLISGVRAISFDAVRLTYSENDLTIDGWWSKLAETFAGDEDVDFYGLYGTYSGLESVNASLYWMFVRDGSSINDTVGGPGLEWFEDIFGYDDYGTTQLHTVGTRIWGGWGALDFDWELAYQFGDADQQGSLFVPVAGIYGDDNAEFDNFGTDLEVGYTFDTRWTPRVYVGGGWYEGEDNRDIRFWDLLNPLYRSEASVSFNRLFAHSSQKYSFILDGGQVLSNFQALRLGVELQPTEKIELGLEVEQFWVDDEFDRPALLFPLLSSVWTRESDDNLGLQTSIWGRYDVTEDLWVRFRWEHLFANDAIEDGNFSDRYGLQFLQGRDDDDADYIETMIGIKF